MIKRGMGMCFNTRYKNFVIYSMILAIFTSFLSSGRSSNAFAYDNTYVGLVRIIETGNLGISNPHGLTFCSKSQIFFVVDGSVSVQSSPDISSDITLITPAGELAGSIPIIATHITNPANMVFDGKADRLLIFQLNMNTLVEIKAGTDGYVNTGTITKFDAQRFNLQNPRGMTVDPVKGHLFILDSAVPDIVHIKPNSNHDFDNAAISRIHLGQFGKSDFRGIAFNPANDHLYTLNSLEQRLYEFTKAGKVVSVRDVSECELRDPQSMVFAPSGDLTDDPSQISLYIANCSSGSKSSKKGQKTKSSDDIQTDAVIGKAAEKGYGNIIEVSLTQPPIARVTSNTTLVRTMDTSLFLPPSPDPSGITYLPFANRLLISDGEVDEMPVFAGVNLFEMSLAGNLLDTLSVMSFSDEPAGLTINPVNRHLFISDDVERKIFELDPGPDGIYDTSDDSLTSFNTRSFGSTDPEGVAYDTLKGDLFIADGLNREVYRVTSGSNGIFDGVPPSGDDQVTHFDTLSIGVDDPEGIEYNPDNNRLYLVGKPKTQLAEITKTGVLTQVFDIPTADARKLAGLAFAPGSLNPNVKNIYIAARGTDNDRDPSENDGKVYEISLVPATIGNQHPIVNAGPNQTIILPENVSLNGAVYDDGLPNSLRSVITTWSKASGPGRVTFDNVNAVDTMASFSMAGTYVLRLTANDSELSASDTITITVLDNPGGVIIDVRVATGSDDAEERTSGNIILASTDLDLVFEKDNQTVGIRFTGVDIPKDATIVKAYIQFKSDETYYGTTSLNIQGEDVDNASPFISIRGNVVSRQRTTASVLWIPVPWTIRGEAGPNQQTPDISSIIQEIVNRPDWSSGNSLAIIIMGTGRRVAESFEGDQAGAPLLHIVYH